MFSGLPIFIQFLQLTVLCFNASVVSLSHVGSFLCVDWKVNFCRGNDFSRCIFRTNRKLTLFYLFSSHSLIRFYFRTVKYEELWLKVRISVLQCQQLLKYPSTKFHVLLSTIYENMIYIKTWRCSSKKNSSGWKRYRIAELFTIAGLLPVVRILWIATIISVVCLPMCSIFNF